MSNESSTTRVGLLHLHQITAPFMWAKITVSSNLHVKATENWSGKAQHPTWHSINYSKGLSRHLTLRQPARTLGLRSSDVPLLIKPFTRTEFAKRAFRHSAPTVWNSLPKLITNCDSLPVFKCRLKTYFFCLSFNQHTQLTDRPQRLWSHDLMAL